MRTRRIKNVASTACQPWCTPKVPCGSPYCCPGVYTVRNPRLRKGGKR
jgi:hypothetical protein